SDPKAAGLRVYQAAAPFAGVISVKLGLAPRGRVFEVIPLRQWDPVSWGSRHDWSGIPPDWNGGAGEAEDHPLAERAPRTLAGSYSHAIQLNKNAHSRQARHHLRVQDPRKGHGFERGANRSPHGAHQPSDRASPHPPEGFPLPPRTPANGEPAPKAARLPEKS